jgi:predicted nucleic acid-binding protein
MTTDALLLDSGVWVAAIDSEDAFVSASRELVFCSAEPVAALDLTLYEVANVVGSRMGDEERAWNLCRSVEDRCTSDIVRISLDLIEATIEIAIDYRLTGYDAAYVAAARRFGWQLVSTDVRDLVSKGLAITPDAAV